MIKNEHLLKEKELKLIKIISEFLNGENIGYIDVRANCGNPVYINFYNDIFIFAFYCEDEIYITNITLKEEYRGKAIFRRLMNHIVTFCKEYNNMPIIFKIVVMEDFEKILMRYNGKLIKEYKIGKDIAILPETWLSRNNNIVGGIRK